MRSYFDEFASYQQIHGRVAPAAMVLMWLYLTSAAVLIGAELNSEIEKAREASGAERKERNEVPDDAPHKGRTRAYSKLAQGIQPRFRQTGKREVAQRSLKIRLARDADCGGDARGASAPRSPSCVIPHSGVISVRVVFCGNRSRRPPATSMRNLYGLLWS